MSNIIEYLNTEFATFEEVPFGPVDSLILSEFCMVRLDGVLPAYDSATKGAPFARIREGVSGLFGKRKVFKFSDALRAEFFDTMFVGLVPDKVRELSVALAASPRFRDIEVRAYESAFDEGLRMQFAAYSFVYKEEFSYIGFRGTDVSYTGWREDFDMAYMHAVPSQLRAVQYVNSVAKVLPGKLILGGHSKGGNLAVYAAVKSDASVKSRIESVYCHDGPGFRDDAFAEGEFEAMRDRIHKTVPKDSVVGLLMERSDSYRVIKSTAKGIMQHDPYSWVIEGFDFACIDSLSDVARFWSNVLDDWLARYDDRELRIIVDALFEALKASGAPDLMEFFKGGPRIVGRLMDAAHKTSGPSREVLMGAAASLSEVTFKNVGGDLTKIFGRGGERD